jgi:hypothetical protein
MRGALTALSVKRTTSWSSSSRGAATQAFHSPSGSPYGETTRPRAGPSRLHVDVDVVGKVVKVFLGSMVVITGMAGAEEAMLTATARTATLATTPILHPSESFTPPSGSRSCVAPMECARAPLIDRVLFKVPLRWATLDEEVRAFTAENGHAHLLFTLTNTFCVSCPPRSPSLQLDRVHVLTRAT